MDSSPSYSRREIGSELDLGSPSRTVGLVIPIPLASNQVNYSLIYRNPEENGVKAACDELGITLIAYSPIAQGRTCFFCTHFLLFCDCIHMNSVPILVGKLN